MTSLAISWSAPLLWPQPQSGDSVLTLQEQALELISESNTETRISRALRGKNGLESWCRNCSRSAARAQLLSTYQSSQAHAATAMGALATFFIAAPARDAELWQILRLLVKKACNISEVCCLAVPVV